MAVSHLKATVREVPRHNCGEKMTWTHLCEEEAAVEEEGIGGDDVEWTRIENNCDCIQFSGKHAQPAVCRWYKQRS